MEQNIQLNIFFKSQNSKFKDLLFQLSQKDQKYTDLKKLCMEVIVLEIQRGTDEKDKENYVCELELNILRIWVHLRLNEAVAAETRMVVLDKNKLSEQNDDLYNLLMFLQGYLLEIQFDIKQANQLYDQLYKKILNKNEKKSFISSQDVFLASLVLFKKAAFQPIKKMIKHFLFKAHCLGLENKLKNLKNRKCFKVFFSTEQIGYLTCLLNTKNNEDYKIDEFFDDNDYNNNNEGDIEIQNINYLLFKALTLIEIDQEQKGRIILEKILEKLNKQKQSNVENNYINVNYMQIEHFWETNILKGIGNSYYNTEEYKEAIEYYNKCLSIDQTNIDCLLNIGSALQVQNNIEEAKEYFKKSISINPKYSESYLYLGEALEKQENDEESLKIYKQCIQENPDDPEPLINIGLVLEQNYELKEALDNYQKAEKLDYYNKTVKISMGKIFLQLEESQKAIQKFEECIKIDPKFCDAYFELASCLELLGQEKQSLGNYKKAVQIEPQFIEAWQAIGSLYENSFQDIKNALNAYKKCLELDPSQEDLLYGVGELLLRQGDVQQSLKYFQQFIAINEENIDMIQDSEIKEILINLQDIQDQQSEYKKQIAQILKIFKQKISQELVQKIGLDLINLFV